MKYCAECGAKLAENVKYCPECGTPVAGEVELPSKSGEFFGPGNTVPAGNGFIGMGMSPLANMKIDPEGRYFSYTIAGMMMNSGFDLKVVEQDGKLFACYRKPMQFKDSMKIYEAEASFFDAIVAILDQNNADRWDGFREQAEGFLDGDSFWFTFRDGKGRSIEASGYMRSPEGLKAAIQQIRSLFEKTFG